ncbi:PucR C-terminal helix-turn-helix domain-containing protein [Propionibacterium cyclohexanicum]|uniref:PucR C-terminal helix-turn-helix domain-containing protein n=1 Tax=Propionibacterium cyclohexanicum TaxID=64702 RepID=A0A1H9QI08_9ACTN|nr:PucR family transcriptional regulator [Propionibacterium cyclohexanicum]SER60084.1 PucR C-terminal helix-turn-helix domain-containing protein [Propionibacterium cyclohexanicum]
MGGFRTETSVEMLHRLTAGRFSLELCAGASGLANSVSWVYLGEDLRNVEFLRGGEFVITTGLFTKDGTTVDEFVGALIEHGCAALLVNLGPYLDRSQLSAELLARCDTTEFPLFVMPWEIHLVDIMQEISVALLDARHREGGLDAAFEAAIYQQPVPTSVLHGLHQFGFPTHAPYRVAVIHNLVDLTPIRSALNRTGVRYHIFRHDNLHVLVHGAEAPGTSESEISALLCRHSSTSVGMSATIPDLSELGSAFRRALFSLSVADLWQRPYVSFAELGALQLLFCVSDSRMLEDLCASYLGPLIAYDEAHESDLVRTLQVFLLADGSVRLTAERLPAHRNTVVYRMRRIKEILGVTLDLATEKFNLLLALYIREYLAM